MGSTFQLTNVCNVLITFIFLCIKIKWEVRMKRVCLQNGFGHFFCAASLIEM